MSKQSVAPSFDALPTANHPSNWMAKLLTLSLAGLALSTLPVRADHNEDRDRDRDREHNGEGRPLLASPQSRAYGKSLSEWLNLYWNWNLRGQDASKSVVNGVKFLPLPAGEQISGTGTPIDPALYRGQVEVTIDSETPFVLPLAGWITETYNNGTPEDAPFSDERFLTAISPYFTIDNQLVLSDCNELDFYVPPTPLKPIVNYSAPSSYGSIAATGFQSIGVVGRPLPVGVHRIHLYEPYIVPGMFGTIFDNTWIITVKKAAPH